MDEQRDARAGDEERGWPEIAPAEYWEERYASADRVWSGRVNRVLADVAAELEPGTALDLGCGEGADVIWLAGHGWDATGVDISPTAVRHATDAAREASLAERARFVAADLSELPGDELYDLVTASFLHSPVALPRGEVLRRAADRVKPGGHLLITSHAAPPAWADAHAHQHHLPTLAEEVETLALDEHAWEVRVAEVREREATSPDGEPATLRDVVILAHRRR